MNIENLKKLSDYFLGLDPNTFDLEKVMALGDNDYHYFRDFIDKNNIKLKDEEIGEENRIIFIIWIENYTGLKYVKDGNVYDWLFHYHWKKFNGLSVDPTPQGVSRRIKYLIENGVPDDFHLQYRGKVEYVCK